jgi:hypothetical protein
MALLLTGLAVGCGGRSPILGGPGGSVLVPTGTSAPQVASTYPATTVPGPTPGVPTGTTLAAQFTESMNPATLTAASFILTGPGAVPVAGVVTYASDSAIFSPASPLAASTTYTATITSAAADMGGNALEGNQAPLPAVSNYVWKFTTGLGPDTTRPTVALTIPVTTTPGPTLAVSNQTAIAAVFSKAMGAGTLNAASFTLTTPAPGLAPLGSVTYSTTGRTAIFTPASPLQVGLTYTATITSAAADASGNRLAGNQASLPAASDYVWSFIAAAVPATPPTVTLTFPVNLATGAALNTAITATFSEPINSLTLSSKSFTLRVSGLPLGPVLAGTVGYDVASASATFTPASPLLAGTRYTAALTGITDLTGSALAAGLVPNPWTFTTGSSAAAPGAVNLGSAGAYGIMATSAITSTGLTVINGDVSLDPGTSVTGFPPAIVNGTTHINDTESAQARIDLLTAYNFATTLPPGTTISGGADLGALYPNGMPPGTYTSGSTMLVSTPLTLDAGGDANAVWVFQIGSSLTTGASVTLANGAQAKNVFWVPAQDATVGVGTIFYGTIVSGRNVSAVTGAVLNGRILAGATTAGTIALDDNTVNVPAP